VPLKMQSAMRPARSDLLLCSPNTQEIASTTFDLPQPFGPTMQVVPEPLKVTVVRSKNDLKPTISTFRSFSKVASFAPARAHAAAKLRKYARRDDLVFPEREDGEATKQSLSDRTSHAQPCSRGHKRLAGSR
jgi:hypothetical protein